jgi:hypothetical protein
MDSAKLGSMRAICVEVLDWIEHQDRPADAAFAQYDSTCNAANVLELINAYQELSLKYANRDLWDRDAPSNPHSALAGTRPEPASPSQSDRPDIMPGPCLMCGAKNYPLSLGGPDICPRCDCSPATDEIAMLRMRIDHLLKDRLLRMQAAVRAEVASPSREELIEALQPFAKLRLHDAVPDDTTNPPTLSRAAFDVLQERIRQVSEEGWDAAHDDEHIGGEIALAASAYSYHAGRHPRPYLGSAPNWWPWDARGWKPKDPRRDLVRAGALIIAEIERLDRASAGTEDGP